jgi:hypothetical protein
MPVNTSATPNPRNPNDPSATLYAVYRFPHPWPPLSKHLILGSTANGIAFELFGLPDGRIELKTPILQAPFVSQRVHLESDRPTWAVLTLILSLANCSLKISERSLLPDAPDAPILSLGPNQGLVPQEFSVNDPNANAKCHTWIQNRKLKFASAPILRPDRRSKTIQEQGNDLLASIYRLRHLQQHTRAGNYHLLGTLAGEMRATVYWPKGRDTKPDNQWNPLLLRMASLADLPLPVYRIADHLKPQIVGAATMHLTPSSAPRFERIFKTDEVGDLQEALLTTVIRLGPSPGRTNSALEIIKELAHTMGAAHYDLDASDFLDVMASLKSEQGDQVMSFMCQTADTLASLSEWVLSELKTRNIIG